MTSLVGPSEAWFASGYPSWEAFERVETDMYANAALAADQDRFSANESDLLSRTSTIVSAHRPALSYQSNVSLPQMRYMQVQLVRVKPGRTNEFRAAWEEIVAAHTKAKMDEHWAVYQVVGGMPDETFMFFFPRKSLAEIDKSGPMHGAVAYRDAVGEPGRARMREMNVNAVEWSQTMVFRLSPDMSILDKEWIDADPAFWTRKPPPAPPAKKK
jgi:hypothetical protein